MDFVWEDPPNPARGHPWVRRLASLKEHPNKWADFGPYTASIASNIKRGRIAGVPLGEFDAVSRMVKGEDKPHLFVRFIGDDLSPE